MQNEANTIVFFNTGIFIIMALSLMVPTIARADAIYNTVILADLYIVRFSSNLGILSSKPDDLLITGDVFVVDERAIIERNALADQFAGAFVVGIDSDALGIDDGLCQKQS